MRGECRRLIRCNQTQSRNSGQYQGAQEGVRRRAERTGYDVLEGVSIYRIHEFVVDEETERKVALSLESVVMIDVAEVVEAGEFMQMKQTNGSSTSISLV